MAQLKIKKDVVRKLRIGGFRKATPASIVAPVVTPEVVSTPAIVDVKAATGADLKKHDYVSHDHTSGIVKGKIVRVSRDGELHVPNSLNKLKGTKEDPAALVRVFADGGKAWAPTAHYIGANFSQLTKIEPLIAEIAETVDPMDESAEVMIESNKPAAEGDDVDKSKAIVDTKAETKVDAKTGQPALDPEDADEVEVDIQNEDDDSEFCQCEGECDCDKPQDPKEEDSEEPKKKKKKKPAKDGKAVGDIIIKTAPAVVADVKVSEKAMSELVGKSVFFASDGQRVAAKVKRIDGQNLIVQLAVPGRDGILRVSDSEITVKATDTEVVDAITKATRMRAFEGGAKVQIVDDHKSATIFDEDNKTIVDYQNVIIEGYASTFQSTTAKDRSGDYILPKAFNRTIPEFMQNPVILTDHLNEVKSIAGSWSKVTTNLKGLNVIGQISNAPGIRDIRFKLKEGHLKGLSIGGIWYYIDDGFGIEDADLFEISLVAVPMNPDALFQTRSLGSADCVKAFSKYWRSHTELQPAA